MKSESIIRITSGGVEVDLTQKTTIQYEKIEPEVKHGLLVIGGYKIPITSEDTAEDIKKKVFETTGIECEVIKP